jgi:hypothetical protein
MKQKQFFIILAILVMVIVLSAYVVAAASQATTGAPIPEITIKAADYSFEAPAQIEAGPVVLTLVNNGQETHHAQLARLNQGVTMDKFLATLKEDPEATMPMLTFVGGPGLLDPGLSQQVTLELTPGQYVLLCFIPAHDGVPHLAKGMIAPIQVVGHTDHIHAHAPQLKADMTVKLRDFEFPLPSQIKAGKQVWQILNEGSQPHEIELIKLVEGKTIEDVQAFMHSPNGAPPFTSIGGFQAITPGQSGWLNLDLEPGNYVALCFVPNPETGKPHIEHGMVLPFSVR